MKLEISLVIITLNEEHNIERCIRSVPFASDIVVVDGKSQDQTTAIAQKLGARVIEKNWMGFGPQKAFAVEQARFDWVLCLDADECLSPALQEEIKARFLSLDPLVCYELPRKSWHLGRWILHGGWYPDYQRRLFNRRHFQWNAAKIHEKVEVKMVDDEQVKKANVKESQDAERLASPIEHYVFRNLSHQIQTNDRYSGLLAATQFEKGIPFSLFKLVVKPPIKFLECYFLKGGFLDGIPGFIIAAGAAYSIFLRWSKLWELSAKLPNAGTVPRNTGLASPIVKHAGVNPEKLEVK